MGGTLSDVQGILIVLCSMITPGEAQLSKMPWTEPRSDQDKHSTHCTIFLVPEFVYWKNCK